MIVIASGEACAYVTCKRVRRNIHTCVTCMTCMYVYIYIYMLMLCMYIYIYTYHMCIYLYMSIHMYVLLVIIMSVPCSKPLVSYEARRRRVRAGFK